MNSDLRRVREVEHQFGGHGVVLGSFSKINLFEIIVVLLGQP
jgi:hypothetical protein